MKSRYKKIKRNGKTILLHRDVMAKHIGRPLLPTEHVHHESRDRFDNQIENLELKDGQKHIEEHAEERRLYPREKNCEVCGSAFTPHRTKRKRAKTCSTKCANALRGITERKTKAVLTANFIEQEVEVAA